MGIFRRLAAFFTGAEIIDDNFYEEIEETLVMADVGVNTTEKIIEALKKKVKEKKIYKPAECKQLLIDSIKEQMNVPDDAYDFENGPTVIMMIGVNGVGKTSAVGKLAYMLKKSGKNVLICAADTFRAAAVEQLAEWGKRADVPVIKEHENADPAAVVFDALNAAKARNTDILIVDTAGRLQNKKNLMDELGKIDRIIKREYPGARRETFVVLDGTTGQNALVQAREFNEVAPVTGIIITKLEGTAKGGIAIAVQAELSVPIKYIGVGEDIKSLIKFDPNSYVDGLFS